MKSSVCYILLLSSLITLALGCSETEQPVASCPEVPDDEVVLTAARLETMAEAEVFLQAAGYAKVYDSLKGEDLDAAYLALEKSALFEWWGHPLYEEWAQLAFRFDSAGQATLPEMMRLHEIELEMAKALRPYKEQVPEFEEQFMKTKRYHDAIVAQGKDPAEVWIGFSISFEETNFEED